MTARVNPPLYLMSVLVGSTQSSIGAMAVAGQELTTTLPGGEFPFSPFSRKNWSPDNANDPYGFTVGQQYTLRWGAAGKNMSSNCGTDDASGVGGSQHGKSFRGYCCTGSQSVPDLAREIALGQGTVPAYVGQNFDDLLVNGQKNAIDDLGPFVNLDTNTTSTNYTQYKASGTGNGKRLIIVAVNDSASTVVGFAEFFLLPASNYSKGSGANTSWCAEYVGKTVQVPGLPPASGSGVYHLKIYR